MRSQLRIEWKFIYILFLASVLVIASCSEKEEVQSAIEAPVEADLAEENIAGSLSVAPVLQEVSDEAGEGGEIIDSWNEHIIRYDQGWVSAEQVMTIDFSHDVQEEKSIDLPIEALVSIRPKVDLDVRFSNKQQLVIRPKGRLKPGQVYSLSLSPEGLIGIPKSLSAFRFQVQALNQSFELNVSGLVPDDSKDKMKLKGTIRTADTVDLDAIQATLNIQQNGNDLPVAWRQEDGGKKHLFEIKGILRGKEKSEVTLKYSALEIGVEKEGVYPILVPAINQFSVTAIRAIQHPKQYVEVSFSEALDRNQNINGLIKIDGETASTRVDGSALRIYPGEKKSGRVSVEIEDTIKSSKRIQLQERYVNEVVFISELPGVRFTDGGSILPPNKILTVPIEAINVDSVWVTAFKVYEHNIPQFLQRYSIQSHALDSSSGRYLWKKKITLPSVPLDEWQRFNIDLSELMEKHQDGFINLSVSINKENSVYECPGEDKHSTQASIVNYEGPNMEEHIQRPQWFHDYYSPRNGYVTYEQRRDPCHQGYYSHYRSKNVRATKNFVVSNLGMIVKKGGGSSLHVVVTDIKNGNAKKRAEITAYNYQHQVVGSGSTDSRGMVTLKIQGQAFYVVAAHKKDRVYLRLPKNSALPVSQFDTGGKKIRKGLKGMIYGERDVWRPGDDIYLTFILQDKEKNIPEGHPVSIDFFDPRGTKILTKTNNQPVGNMYPFVLKTDESSPTGSWRAVVRVGGEYFDKTLKIETITPNRLKVELAPAVRPIRSGLSPVRTELFAQWLNGATAKNLRADTELKLSPTKTYFEGWSQFTFDDPASHFRQYRKKVFDGQLDANGRAAFNVDLRSITQAPGKLRANFVTRIFEQSGNFSTSIRSEEVLPYENWVGLNIPKGSGYRNAISRDKAHEIYFASVDSQAKPVANRELTISVYRIGWRWWWDQSEENLANFISGRNANRVANESLVTDDKGRASWTLKKNTYSWGRHLIRVCDDNSGHCSGQEVYLGWSWANQVSPDSATQLMLSTDKARYTVGDVATIRIPALAQGKVLYSLENGSQVIKQDWLNLKPGDSSFQIKITEEMAPNIYLNVSLLLPHAERESDAPLRMYGITPLLVDNPKSRLTPIVDAPKSVRPSSTFEVTVRETEGRPMEYTLAVVDEGLLGITNYKTPDPRKVFYQREALGVSTWDMYDNVVGAYGANLERLLKIGGGDAEKGGKKRKERRFPPVVKFLGAFSLPESGSRIHKVKLPQYMGAVRVMVVAASDTAYGKAEQTVTVTQPLTLLATLPRVLGPNEEVTLPVNVFVNNDEIKKVKVRATTNHLFTLTESKAELEFQGPGDKIATLSLKVNDQVGPGRVTIVAESGDEKTEQTIHIESRSPNLPTTVQESKLIQPGEVWSPSLTPNGMLNTNTASLMVSSFPSLNIDHRLGYLIRYPHGCVEQTTSAIFPQIFLGDLTNLSKEERDAVQDHVDAAVSKYKTFQNTSGAFSYWPSSDYVNDWSSTYVSHFLVEAKALGYAIPKDMLDDALKYLRESSKNNVSSPYSRLVTAYQLYVLASASVPELPAMNRLREELLRNEENYNDKTARWMLSLAYQSLGIGDVAIELIDHSDNAVKDYRYGEYTYGSSLRDMGILLMSYHASDKNEAAWEQAVVIAKRMGEQRWYSTHTTSWALLALSKYAKGLTGESHKFSIKEAGGKSSWQAVESINTVYKQKISPLSLKARAISIRNDSDRPLHVAAANTGIPSEGNEQEKSSGLELKIDYQDLKGNPLEIDNLPQGKDFAAVVTVKGLNLERRYKIEDIALSMVMPSGWQIRNERLEGDDITKGLDYQDIRDDRVLSYFSLWKNYYWNYRYNDSTRDEQTVKVILNASFSGTFYLPGWNVSSMYDEKIGAQSKGKWVTVVSEEDR